MDTLPMGYKNLLKNIDYSYNEEKDKHIENFLESFDSILKQTFIDFSNIYGDKATKLSILIPQFEDVKGAAYRFMITIKNSSSEQEDRLADLYNITNHAYNYILNLKGDYEKIPNKEPKSYLDMIDSNIHFYSNSYVVILDIIQPLIILVLDKFLPGIRMEIIDKIKHSKLLCGLEEIDEQ